MDGLWMFHDVSIGVWLFCLWLLNYGLYGFIWIFLAVSIEMDVYGWYIYTKRAQKKPTYLAPSKVPPFLCPFQKLGLWSLRGAGNSWALCSDNLQFRLLTLWNCNLNFVMCHYKSPFITFKGHNYIVSPHVSGGEQAWITSQHFVAGFSSISASLEHHSFQMNSISTNDLLRRETRL